ncbi:class I SAM-dependent methyltransferase [Proteinivorax tanatarense]|uniref:Class I SAM-dependent methyltransferase n=1 Tax=Proteinivorax tanatarense TaxID=1260629 RepID=A0AAU7VNB5_9FIRM
MNAIAFIDINSKETENLRYTIDGKMVIEHTIEKLMMIREIEAIILPLHKCKENKAYKKLEEKYPIKVFFSKEQNLGKKMVAIAKELKPQHIIRVMGDQMFLDTDVCSAMLQEMTNKTLDINYADLNCGLAAQIFTYNALKKCQIVLGKYHRTNNYINENPDQLKISTYTHPHHNPYFRFLVRSDREKKIAEILLNTPIDFDNLEKYIEILCGETGLYNRGWFETFKNKESLDKKGNPLPWFTYQAVTFLEERVKSKWDVFEYGCGYSSLWWSKRVSSVTSCEHNLQWLKMVQTKAGENVNLIYADFNKERKFAEKILQTKKKYDVIVIDSKERIKCAKYALRKLKPSGVIIWDDAERDQDKEGQQFIVQQGFKRITFTGMSPIVKHENETAIFYREGNCLGI